MAEGESAEKHLLNMSELCDRLAAVELPVPEEFQPLMILASVPASYTAIVQTLGSHMHTYVLFMTVYFLFVLIFTVLITVLLASLKD